MSDALSPNCVPPWRIYNPEELLSGLKIPFYKLPDTISGRAGFAEAHCTCLIRLWRDGILSCPKMGLQKQVQKLTEGIPENRADMQILDLSI